jgi:hypothetical protein
MHYFNIILFKLSFEIMMGFYLETMLVILIVILIYLKNILLIKNSPIIFKTIMFLYDDIKKN